VFVFGENGGEAPRKRNDPERSSLGIFGLQRQSTLETSMSNRSASHSTAAQNVPVEKAGRLGWLYRRHSVAAQRNVLLSRAILAIETLADSTFAYAEVDRIRNSVGKNIA
jgi:hypothetical protein